MGQHDWYLLAQYMKFRDGLRGADPEDVWGQTMVANAEQTDLQGVLDVLAYLETQQ